MTRKNSRSDIVKTDRPSHSGGRSEMTGEQFENLFCELMKKIGYWALKIPRNNAGAQPFDVIAIRGYSVFAIDCKVCSRGVFELRRVEDNQWSAFKVISERTNANVGIMAYYDGCIYCIPYRTLKECSEAGMKSIKLTKLMLWMSKQEVELILGDYNW